MTGRLVLNTGLGILLLITLGLNWYVRQPKSTPNVEFMPDMVRGPAFRTFEPNPNFPDGLTQRTPVAGTIARGAPPLGFGPAPVEAMRAGNELANPYAITDRAAVERGGLVFSRYCVLCHGEDGKGGGLVIEHGFRRPPTLLRPFARSMKDGQMLHLVTYGRGAMPGHGAQIPLADRWKAILHVRALQAREPLAAPPAAGGASR